jgi:hypothetical protein
VCDGQLPWRAGIHRHHLAVLLRPADRLHDGGLSRMTDTYSTIQYNICDLKRKAILTIYEIGQVLTLNIFW